MQTNNTFMDQTLFRSPLIQKARELGMIQEGIKKRRLCLDPDSEPSSWEGYVDEKLETRAVSPTLGDTHLPESIRQQLNNPEGIGDFEVLESLFEDLEKESQGIAASVIPKNLKDYRLKELQRIAEGFIHTFKGEFSFVNQSELIERIEAIFKFFPLNMRIQFEQVSKISLGFMEINRVAQWFLGDKTSVHLVDAVIEDLPAAMYGLSEFTTIDISGCPNLKSIKHIGLCESLKVLKAHNLKCLQTLEGIGECNKLKNISLKGCKNLQDISALTSCLDLEEISLKAHKALRDIHTLIRWPKLKKIHFSRCKNFKFLGEFEEYQNLEEINFKGCLNIQDLRGLIRCQKLKKIHLWSCKRLRDISSLGECLDLEEVYFHGCLNLKDLSVFIRCRKIKKLHLIRCHNLQDISVLAKLLELEELSLTQCRNLKDLSVLANCQKLKKINLSQCNNLHDVSILNKLLELEEVSFVQCENPKDLSVLADCQKLKKIRLHISQNCLFRELPEPLQKIVEFN